MISIKSKPDLQLIKKVMCLQKYYICLFIKPKRKGLFKKISDKNILEGIRQQDSKVLNYIYDHYYQTVKNHVTKNRGTDDDVPDVFQDTIIELYKHVLEDNFTLTTDLKGYFFGIARNIWNAHLRYKKRTVGIETDIAEEAESDELFDLVLERIMSRAFQKLKPDCQTVLTLFSDGYSYEEIAGKMKLKNEIYARRKKYLCKEALIEIVKEDPEYQEYLRLLK